MWESRAVCEISKGRWKEWESCFGFSTLSTGPAFPQSPDHLAAGAIFEMRTLRSYILGGTGDSILHCRRSCALAVVILRAHSVSLIFRAICSNCAKLTLGFKYVSTFSNPCNFSYGVA